MAIEEIVFSRSEENDSLRNPTYLVVDALVNSSFRVERNCPNTAKLLQHTCERAREDHAARTSYMQRNGPNILGFGRGCEYQGEDVYMGGGCDVCVITCRVPAYYI